MGMGLLHRSRHGMFVLALQTGLNINQVFACFHQRCQLLARGIVGLTRRPIP
jgi:hypothetical protein